MTEKIRQPIHLNNVPLSMIVAMDANGGIGKEGKLPWPKHKKDFQKFKEITMDSVVIMGRKTFEEIEAINDARGSTSTELLPGRKCVVISSKELSTKYEIFVESSLISAVQYYYEEGKSIFVIGGLQLYTEALPFVRNLYVTQFKNEYACDKYLPLRYMSHHFSITEGTEEDDLYFLKCDRVVG